MSAAVNLTPTPYVKPSKPYSNVEAGAVMLGGCLTAEVLDTGLVAAGVTADLFDNACQRAVWLAMLDLKRSGVKCTAGQVIERITSVPKYRAAFGDADVSGFVQRMRRDFEGVHEHYDFAVGAFMFSQSLQQHPVVDVDPTWKHSPEEVESILDDLEKLPNPNGYTRDELRAALESGNDPAQELKKAKGPVYVSVAEQLRQMANDVHAPCGFPTIDAMTEGGPLLGDVFVIGGAPTAGKTMLALNLSLNYASTPGYIAAFLASDEPRKRLLVRAGQSCGFDKRELQTSPETRAIAGAEVAARYPGFHLFDAYDGWTIESVHAWLLENANGAHRILTIDSMQTVPALGTDIAGNALERAKAVVEACKRVAGSGALVIATSEVGRGHYRSNNRDEQVNDLAAFKESGAIEFGVQLAVVLRREKGSQNVDATTPKNRTGVEQPEFRLVIDTLHSTMSEGTLPDPVDQEQERDRRREASAEKLCAKILATVGKNPGVRSANELARKTGGTRATAMDCIRDMLNDARLVKLDGVFRVGG